MSLNLITRVRRRSVALLLTAAAVSALAPAGADTAVAAGPSNVTVLDYTLGDRVFTAPNFHVAAEDGGPGKALAPLELTGNLHLPGGPGAATPLPVVVLSHGYWQTCADPAAARQWTAALAAQRRTQDPEQLARLREILVTAGRQLSRWPCAPGTPALPSYRGLDYLADALAAQGFAVLSVSANGANAGEIGDAADAARATVINRNLALVRQLATTGGGPLAGKLVDRATRRPATVDLRGRLDFSHVGTLGHSRGGRGVMWQAADVHRDQWPEGVTIKAAFGLAPAGTNPTGPDAAHYRVTGAAVGVWSGTCDVSANGGADYVEIDRSKTALPIFQVTVEGANHNFLNTQWSPSSHQVLATDDAIHAEHGRCADRAPQDGKGDGKGKPTPPHLYRQLTESQERQVAVTYLSAFFRRWLMDDHSADAILSGREQPLAGVAKVTATLEQPSP